ncbi:MAG: WD40 repeat domain-containing protein [Chloroflexota bacterium]
MEQTSKRNRTLFLIGLLLALALLFASQNLTRQNPQTAGGTAGPVVSLSPDYGKTATYVLSIPTNNITATYRASLPKFPTPIESPATPITPTATSTLQPPQCTFPLAGTTMEESKPEEYTFSEPRVLLTAAQGNPYSIAQWLPDSQQVLIIEKQYDIPDRCELIKLYNPETGESKVYAIRPITHEPPFWQPELKAVVYPVMKYFDVIDRNTGINKFTRQIWVSYGNPDTAQMLADNLPQLPFAISPDGSELVYLSDEQLSRRDKSLKELAPVPADIAQWDYAKERRSNQPVSYSMSWRPDTSLIFLYSKGYEGGGGYTFVLNANTGHICELNLGGWVSRARWSSDGRYLAIGRVTGPYPAVLTILDATTGELTTLIGTPQGSDGQLYLYDFVWAPDSRHLLAIGIVTSIQNTQDENNTPGLYLVDIASGQSIHVSPEYKSYVSSQDNNFAWSPDSSKLIIRCPSQTVDQICIIPVQRAK